MAAGDFVSEIATSELAGSASSTIVLTVGAGGVAQGNTIVAIVGGFKEAASATDSQGNTYTLQVTDGDGTKCSSILTALAATALTNGDTITITLAASATNECAIGLEFEGDCSVKDQSASYDTGGVATTAVDTPSTAALGATDDVYVMCLGRDGSSTLTLTDTTGGITQATKVSTSAGTSRSLHSGYMRLAASTAVDYQGTLSGSRSFGCCVLCLTVDSGGGGASEIDATGLNVPITFGSPEVLPLVEATGLNVAITFGSPEVLPLVETTGLNVPITFGSPDLVPGDRPKIEALTDNFDDGSLQAAFLAYEGGTVTTTEQNGHIEVDLNAQDYGSIYTADTYDLTDSYFQVEILAADPVNDGVATEFYLYVSLDGSNFLTLHNFDQLTRCHYTVGGSNTVISSVAGDVPRWLRIRETSGTVYFEYGDGSSWTTLGSVATPFDITELTFEAGVGAFAPGDPTGTVIFDNWNVSLIEPTGLNVPITFGSPEVLPLVEATGLNVPITFGSASLTAGTEIDATGLNVPITFGSPEVLPLVEATGLNVPITFGSPEVLSLIEATGLAVSITFGSPTVEGSYTKMGDVQDNFNDDSLDTTLFGTFTSTGCTVTETGGRIELSIDNGGASRYAVLFTDEYHDLTDSELKVEIVDMGLVAATAQTLLMVEEVVGDNDRAYLDYLNGTLYARTVLGGVSATPASAAVTPRWLRMREASGTLYWEYSTEDSPTEADWTELHSEATPIIATAVQGTVTHGHWTAAGSGTAIIDNFNVSTISATGLNVGITFGSPEVLQLIEATGLAVAITFGSATVIRHGPRKLINVEMESNVIVVELGTGVAFPAILEDEVIVLEAT